MTDQPPELAEVREHIKEAKDAAEQAEQSGIADATPDKPFDEGDAEEAADTD
ncbi:hypothetical protein VA596_27200 [Amycolatopsis sp., V23-08]|uniref:Uncharacterized protein n=1 Tax=Amycolatopsis heterodermiae TaxID=3110235 RepID=A0ABU5RAH9_9PSEU|nr:hypothetical protein [Amycolatopsis sp., V23-08]MEA5363247.1 hypothetical protein [Amycolatopsis sp., V23-08]